jgi:GT2 family glycosyltransferase
MTQVSIITVCFNKVNFTLSALSDLCRLETSNEIICIDNASTDDTQKKLSSIGNPNFHYIRNEQNLFHSQACNQGAHIAKGKYIIFINNDIRVKSNHKHWTDDVIKHCDEAIVGPTMGVLDNNFNFIKEANEQLSGNSYLSGWFMASSRENWDKLCNSEYHPDQIWDEKFPFYFNDTNMGFECRKLGIPQKVIDVPITHFGKISAKQINVQSLYTAGRKTFLEKWEK